MWSNNGDVEPDAGPTPMALTPGQGAEVSDAATPDADHLDVEAPDVEQPDVEIPDSEIPDSEIPDSEIPDAAPKKPPRRRRRRIDKAPPRGEPDAYIRPRIDIAPTTR